MKEIKTMLTKTILTKEASDNLYSALKYYIDLNKVDIDIAEEVKNAVTDAINIIDAKVAPYVNSNNPNECPFDIDELNTMLGDKQILVAGLDVLAKGIEEYRQKKIQIMNQILNMK